MPGSSARFDVIPLVLRGDFFLKKARFWRICFGGGKGLVKLHNLALSFLVEIAKLRQGH